MNQHQSTDDPDATLLETWRQRMAAFRIHPNRLSYMDGGKVVASGGFGQVKKAIFNGRTSVTTSTTRGITVAVKTLQIHVNVDTERLEKRFMREAYVWSQLKNDHITEFLGFYFSCSDGKMEALLICPWMENGQSVRYVQQQGLPSVKRLQLLLDAARGLQYLHSRVPPICHGDIKGSNVLIRDDGRAAICDFGLAQVLDEEFERLASQTIHRGTVRWTSPERLDHDGPLAPSSDVWSWAWLIWEFMTEKIPFHLVSNSSAVIFHIVTLKLPAYERDPAIAEVPTLSKLMQLCWQREPESRLQMDECIDRLEQILEGFESTQMTGNGHPLQHRPEEAPSTFQPMTASSFLVNHPPVSTSAPSRGRVEEAPGVGYLQLLPGVPLPPPTASTDRPPRSADPRKDLPPIPGQDIKTYAATASDSSNEQRKGPMADFQAKFFSANVTENQPSSSRSKPLTSFIPTRSLSSGTANKAPRIGIKKLTKRLLPSSKRKTQQSNSHDEELWDWDIVPSQSPPETTWNTSDSSRPINNDATDLRDQQIDYILKTLQRLESSQEQHSQRQRDISSYLSRLDWWLSGAPLFGSPHMSVQGRQPMYTGQPPIFTGQPPMFTGQPITVQDPPPTQIVPYPTGVQVFGIPPTMQNQPLPVLAGQPQAIIIPGSAMPFIPPITTGQAPTGPGSRHSSIASSEFVFGTGHPIVIQQPPASTGIQPPAIIRIPSNRGDSRTSSSPVAQYSGVVLNAPTARDPIIIQQPSVSPGIQPPAVIRIGDPRTPTPPPIIHLEYPPSENYPVASHGRTPSSIASYFSSYYSEAFSAERTGRTKRYAARARPADLPVTRRFRENELQMHAFEGKDHVTMGVLSEAGRMIAVKPVNFRFDDGEYASESAIMNEFDDWLRLWGSLRHDNIAELVGSVFFNGTPSVITYRVASGNVGDYLRGNPQADRPNLLRQVAEGLKYLHTRPVEIVHSNLKPYNILVENGRVELGDIGILEFLEMKGVGAEMHGKTGDVRWTAPEVLEGPDRQWWSDVYSFGCLALYILKDEIPYSTLETDVAVSKAIYRGELPVNRDAASKLHPTWKLCWSHDPKRRPNMATVLESLDDW